MVVDASVVVVAGGTQTGCGACIVDVVVLDVVEVVEEGTVDVVDSCVVDVAVDAVVCVGAMEEVVLGSTVTEELVVVSIVVEVP